MKKGLFVICTVVLIFGLASVAEAQATRTWVSGVGDDVNPCSRTAPCKTYAGAISKTAAGGIISTLDPGGFGAVTITKSMTIDGTGQIGSILAAGTNGVVINAAATDTVVLRNLDIHGANTGFDGIRMVNIGIRALHVESCKIEKMTSQGIEVLNTSGATEIYVRNSEIRNNTSHGILIIPTLSGSAKLVVSDSSISNNSSNGIEIDGAVNRAEVYNSNVDGNGVAGFFVATVGSEGVAQGSSFSYNGTGIFSGTSGAVQMRLTNNVITGNTTNGIARSGFGGATGTVTCFTNNMIEGNTGNQTCTSSVLGK
jgi:Right handed beta helix region